MNVLYSSWSHGNLLPLIGCFVKVYVGIRKSLKLLEFFIIKLFNDKCHGVNVYIFEKKNLAVQNGLKQSVLLQRLPYHIDSIDCSVFCMCVNSVSVSIYLRLFLLLCYHFENEKW